MTYAILNIADAGDNIVSPPACTAAPTTFSRTRCRSFGIDVRFVDPDKPENFRARDRPNDQADLRRDRRQPELATSSISRRLAAIAHEAGMPLIVDNTMPTPVPVPAVRPRRRHRRPLGDQVHRRPRHLHRRRHRRLRQLRLGGPRGPVPGPDRAGPAYHGCVLTEALGPPAYIVGPAVLLRNMGAAISPMNAFLFLQGLETLHLRMERHCDNALRRAQYLAAHDAVVLGELPGPGRHPLQEVAERTFPRRVGGLLSFGLKSGVRAASLDRGAGALQPPGQHRRRQVPGDPQRHHHPLPAERRTNSRPPACRRTWCGSRSASRTSTT